jgi:hypothetical protein
MDIWLHYIVLHYAYPRKTKTTTIIIIIIIITVSSFKTTLSDTMMIVGSVVLAATTEVKYYASEIFWKVAQRTTSLPKKAV